MSPSVDWHTNTIQYQTFTAPIIQQPSQSIDNKSKQNETKEMEESNAQQVILFFSPLIKKLKLVVSKLYFNYFELNEFSFILSMQSIYHN